MNASPAELEELRFAVRAFVDDKVAPLLNESEKAGSMSPALLDLIRDQGYCGLRIAEQWGGKALPFAQFCLVLEEFARLGPTLHFWLIDSVGLTIQRLGTQEQKERYLRGYANWEIRGALGFSEPNAGSDAAAIRTRAVQRRHGRLFSSNRGHRSVSWRPRWNHNFLDRPRATRIFGWARGHVDGVCAAQAGRIELR